MSSATLPSGLHVLQALHEDWQTVGALVSEIGAFQIEGLPPHGDVEMLVVRLCARLYALSQVEMELLYPLLENCPALDSGRTLHEQVVGDVHDLLDAVVEDDHFEASITRVAQHAHLLRQFEYAEIYPRCAGTDVDSIAVQLSSRRSQLLDSFNTE